jgi:hypothetical protein
MEKYLVMKGICVKSIRLIPIKYDILWNLKVVTNLHLIKVLLTYVGGRIP